MKECKENGQPHEACEFNVFDHSTNPGDVAVKNVNTDTLVKTETAAVHSYMGLSVFSATTLNRYCALLQTLRVTVRSECVIDNVTVLLETGCDRPYISRHRYTGLSPGW